MARDLAVEITRDHRLNLIENMRSQRFANVEILTGDPERHNSQTLFCLRAGPGAREHKTVRGIGSDACPKSR